MTTHIVWDWNGTLLDDLHVVVEAVNHSLGALGAAVIDEEQYRQHFTRPVRSFYDALLQRRVTDHEWENLNTGFHDHYFALVATARLAPDAREALDLVESRGWGQSLLSMTPQTELEEVVAATGISHRFELIDGLRGPTGGLKGAHLERHMEALELQPGSTVVVGDTPDDAAAAARVGAGSILYDGAATISPPSSKPGHPSPTPWWKQWRWPPPSEGVLSR